MAGYIMDNLGAGASLQPTLRNDGPISCAIDQVYNARIRIMEMRDRLMKRHDYLGTGHSPRDPSAPKSQTETSLDGVMPRLSTSCVDLHEAIEELFYQVERFDLVS